MRASTLSCSRTRKPINKSLQAISSSSKRHLIFRSSQVQEYECNTVCGTVLVLEKENFPEMEPFLSATCNLFVLTAAILLIPNNDKHSAIFGDAKLFSHPSSHFSCTDDDRGPSEIVLAHDSGSIGVSFLAFLPFPKK